MQNDRWLNESKALGGYLLNPDYLEGFWIWSHQAHFSSLGPLGDLRLLSMQNIHQLSYKDISA